MATYSLSANGAHFLLSDSDTHAARYALDYALAEADNVVFGYSRKPSTSANIAELSEAIAKRDALMHVCRSFDRASNELHKLGRSSLYSQPVGMPDDHLPTGTPTPKPHACTGWGHLHPYDCQ